jgi:biopolymer transport protein ExbD
MSELASARSKKGGPTEMDITSLLDIIVTLLFFLNQFSNVAALKPVQTEGINPPDSQTKDYNHINTTVQASESLLYVDTKKLISSKDEYTYGPDGKTILPLYDELVKKKEGILMLRKATDQANEFNGAINVIMDKTVKYSFIQKILYTAAQAGFGTYQLVVRGER